MKYLFVCVVAILLVGCDASSQKAIEPTGSELKVSVIGTTTDGCTIYRFRDGMDNHYFVRCVGQPDVATSTMQPCGKNCLYPDEITSIETR